VDHALRGGSANPGDHPVSGVAIIVILGAALIGIVAIALVILAIIDQRRF
jgi:hypothetical protein